MWAARARLVSTRASSARDIHFVTTREKIERWPKGGEEGVRGELAAQVRARGDEINGVAVVVVLQPSQSQRGGGGDECLPVRPVLLRTQRRVFLIERGGCQVFAVQSPDSRGKVRRCCPPFNSYYHTRGRVSSRFERRNDPVHYITVPVVPPVSTQVCRELGDPAMNHAMGRAFFRLSAQRQCKLLLWG